MKDSRSSSPPLGKELIIATTNAGKFEEICSGLSFLKISLRSLNDFQKCPEVQETGSTFEENARLKAVFYHNHLGRSVLAEDSGLVVPALGGFPGIHSARIAEDDASRIRCVLERLEEVEKGFSQHDPKAAGQLRSADFVCCLVFAGANNTYAVEGRCHGRIQARPSGTQGFGYDPIFAPEGSSKTFGQMDRAEKAAFSHRGKALKAVMPFLMTEFQPESSTAKENQQT